MNSLDDLMFSLDDLMFRIRLCELFLVNSSEMSLNDDLIVFSSYQ